MSAPDTDYTNPAATPPRDAIDQRLREERAARRVQTAVALKQFMELTAPHRAARTAILECLSASSMSPSWASDVLRAIDQAIAEIAEDVSLRNTRRASIASSPQGWREQAAKHEGRP